MKQNKDFWKGPQVRFLVWFGCVFLGTFLVLYFIGFVPDELSPGSESVLNDLKLKIIEGAGNTDSKGGPEQRLSQTGETPTLLVIPEVGISIAVENPKSADNAVLNEYLARGAVHYPGSADLGVGNVFIFGHSSNWAVVQNKAYKALNGIEKLKRGDTIYVDSDTYRYVYEVTRVRLATADEAYVDFSISENMLTLSTCDIFGARQNRFVAEAIFSQKISLE